MSGDCSSELLNCSVCLDFLSSKEPVVATNCGHVFHRQCLKLCYVDKKRKKRCPTCRTKVTDQHQLFFSSVREKCEHQEKLEQIQEENQRLREALRRPPNPRNPNGPPLPPPRRSNVQKASAEGDKRVPPCSSSVIDERTNVLTRIARRLRLQRS